MPDRNPDTHQGGAQVGGTPSIGGGVFDSVRLFTVQIREDWGVPWQTVPYLQPLRATYALAPAMSRADFALDYGRVKREDQSSFNPWSPSPLVDRFVRILAVPNGQPPYVIWAGVFPHEGYEIDGAEDQTQQPRGRQIVTALGYEYLLDIRRADEWSLVAQDGLGQELLHRVPRPLVFNRRADRGGQTLGNRSTARKTLGTFGRDPGADESYVFSKDAELWTFDDILQYYLALYWPRATVFLPSGQTDLLANYTGVVDPTGKSVWRVLNDLIDRRRGLAFGIFGGFNDGAEPILHVASIFGDDITFDGKVYPGNPNPVSFDFETDIDMQNVVVSVDHSARVSNIVVRGSRIIATFPVSFADGTLERGWTDDEQTAYLAGANSDDDGAANDRVRDELDGRVFRAFRIPLDWDWKVKDGQGTGISGAMNFATDDFGRIDPSAGDIRWFNFGRTVERQTRLVEAAEAANAQPEYRPMVALLKRNGGFWPAHALNSADVPNGQVRPMDREMGIEVAFRPAHILALNHWEGAKPSNVEPQFDWQEMILVLSIQTDDHLEVRWSDPNVPQFQRKTMIIDVPEAELHYTINNCPIGLINGDIVVQEGFEITRDDSQLLRDTLALARAYYGETRARVSFQIAEISSVGTPGQYITDVSGNTHQFPVGTIITERTWDFTRFTTAIRTDFGHIDARAAVY